MKTHAEEKWIEFLPSNDQELLLIGYNHCYIKTKCQWYPMCFSLYVAKSGLCRYIREIPMDLIDLSEYLRNLSERSAQCLPR